MTILNSISIHLYVDLLICIKFYAALVLVFYYLRKNPESNIKLDLISIPIIFWSLFATFKIISTINIFVVLKMLKMHSINYMMLSYIG